MLFGLPDWFAVVAVFAWGLLGWVILPRLSVHRLLCTLEDALEMPRGKGPARVAVVLERLTDYAIWRAGQTLKGKIAGVASGESRLTKGVMGALTLDVIAQQSPVIYKAIKSWPELERYIRKHPEATEIALGMIRAKFPDLEQHIAQLSGALVPQNGQAQVAQTTLQP